MGVRSWFVVWAALALGTLACSGDGASADESGNAGGSGGSAGSAGAGTSGSAGASGSGGSAGSSASGGSGGTGASAVGPRYIGRFDTRAGAPRFAWPGSAVEVAFEGTEIAVTLTDPGTNWFEVIVDGEHSRFGTEDGTHTYELATGLEPGRHELLLYRRTEPVWGVTRLEGFELSGGTYLPPPPAPERRLALIGDSISAGYGNEGAGPYCDFTPETENHYLTYGAIAARELGAELHTTAWSGIGMFRNYEGTFENTMPDRFPRALPEDPDSVWDFSAFQPHAVLVNLGTNDFAAGDPGPGYREAYEEFVEDLRAHYPNARLYLILTNGFWAAEDDLNDIVAVRADAGDDGVAVLKVEGSRVDEGYGCQWHPSLETHARMAEVVVDALRRDLGW